MSDPITEQQFFGRIHRLLFLEKFVELFSGKSPAASVGKQEQ
jgi:hypothetical protein